MQSGLPNIKWKTISTVVFHFSRIWAKIAILRVNLSINRLPAVSVLLHLEHSLEIEPPANLPHFGGNSVGSLNLEHLRGSISSFLSVSSNLHSVRVRNPKRLTGQGIASELKLTLRTGLVLSEVLYASKTISGLIFWLQGVG
jgi:hypothetical protein